MQPRQRGDAGQLHYAEDAQLNRALQYSMPAILATQGEVCVGGYKKSGIGREIHKMALSYYTNVKNLCFCPDEGVPPLF